MLINEIVDALLVSRLGPVTRTNPLPGLTCCVRMTDPGPAPVAVPVDGLALSGLVGFLIAACTILPLLPVLVLVRLGSAASISRVRAVASPPSPIRFLSSCRTI